VRYATRVLAVEPVFPTLDDADPGTKPAVRLLKITALDVRAHTLRIYTARNLSVGTGATPRVPPLFLPHLAHSRFDFDLGFDNIDIDASKSKSKSGPGAPPIVHTSAYLPALRALFGPAAASASFAGRLAVLGAGQSAAEVFNDLSLRFPRARVDLVHRASALVPAVSPPPSPSPSPFSSLVA
jgi:L-ornithine N5-monooxygenase